MSYMIRPMEMTDIEEVASIEKSIFSMPWSENSFIDAIKSENNIYLVCIEGNQVAGYCGMWTVLDEANVTNVAVSKNHRGKGYGRALMNMLEKYGLERNIDIFYLEVRKNNEVAKNLYLSLGYKNIGVRKNFYEKPIDDAVVMTKTFGN